MKVVIYFTHTGNNQKVAHHFKNLLNSNILQIKDRMKRNFFRDSFYAIIKKEVQIELTGNDLGNYKEILIVTPIWAGNVPAPIYTFLKRHQKDLNTKTLYFISVSGFGEKNKKVLETLKRKLGMEFKGSLFIKDKEIEDESYKNIIDKFIEEFKLKGE